MERKEFDRKLILEDGSEYYGYAFGDTSDKVTEIVFNTSMVGYQEIISDPSYTYQSVVMTYPLIGNYGIANDDFETDIPTIGGLIVREYNDFPSNFRSKRTLSEIMEKYHITGISGIDTRKLTRSIRDLGSRRVLITGLNTSIEEGLKIIEENPYEHDAVKSVSCKSKWRSNVSDARYHIVAIDCGIKQNIIRSLNDRKCNVTIVPYNTSADDIIELNPDGVFISNGPGDPTDVPEVTENIRKLIGKYPIFGICLGHQIICLSYGAKTYKLKFGHRGGNHPVKNLLTEKIEITSQNHSFAVDAESLKNTELEATHINILDNTIEGARCVKDKAFSVQYHPESAPGPQDSSYLFDEFISLIEER
ncbi:MAG: glutamine-hydrolyzing carbamoyl-phosphate synthase small subunit [Lachnospiraceae bacterium]|nr:glutamine-hydrolyzing carbamoyl-phosphate synthase small subunit [Lachnospiraceae bacterium]